MTKEFCPTHAVVGILLLIKYSYSTRPVSLLRTDEIPSLGNKTNHSTNNTSRECQHLVKRNIEDFEDTPEDSRWRREREWFGTDRNKNNKKGERQDSLLARQEDIDRWLRKRGSSPVDLDPEGARVAAKQSELQELLQQLYEAQAAVKMETGEVTRTQQVAQESQVALEEATNKVRMLSADLQAAQEAAAAAAMRAHTAQLQLSAHDQLMFTARQRVDALSAQMVSIQAELAAAQQAFTLTNSSHLLEAQGRGGGLIALSQSDKLFNRQANDFSLLEGSKLSEISPPDFYPSLASSLDNDIARQRQDDLISASLPYPARKNYNYPFP